MKIFNFLILSIMFISPSLFAEKTPFDLSFYNEKPTIKRITPNEMNELYKKSLENTKRNNPALYKQIMNNRNISQKTTKDDVGDVRDFSVVNIETGSLYTVTATLRAVGANCQVWAENENWNNYVTQSDVDSILSNLEEHTSSISIDPSKGIYEIDTEYFGSPPNVDGDGMVDFLVLDIKDGWDGDGGFVAGFFNPGDQTGNNNCDILYLDSNPGIYHNGIETVMSTTAHELQHLIHHNYDPDEEDWLNEAMSQLAGTLCGYGLDDPGKFLANTNLSLTGWAANDDPEVLDHYSKVNLWAEYMLEQFGLEFMTALVQNTLRGSASVNAILNSVGATENFNSSYTNWILCNYINDTGVNSKWGYTNEEALGLKALAENVTSYPFNTSDEVKQYGAHYYKYFEGDTLSVTFNSSSAFAKLIKYTDHNIQVEDMNTGIQYTDNGFNDSIHQEIVVVGSYSPASFSIQSDASSDYYIDEISYDNGTPDVFDSQSGASFLGTGDTTTNYGWAVKFNVEEENINYLLGMKVYAQIGQNSNGNVQIHVWAPSNGHPGNEMTTPIEVTMTDGWNEIDLKQLTGEEISIAGDFYIGFTHADINSEVFIGMDNTTKQNYTWFIRPNAQYYQLQELNSNYSDFNMMMRAIVKIRGEAPSPPIVYKYHLEQNYPNPFNPRTTIKYDLKEDSKVNLSIYNLLGQKVRTLINNEFKHVPGDLVDWDGTDDHGNIVPSGIYFYRIECKDYTKTKRMVFMR